MTDETRTANAWIAFGALLLAFGIHSLYGEAWQLGPTRFVPRADTVVGPMDQITRADYRIVVGRVAGNARAFSTFGTSVFEKPQCFPAEDTLTTGDPMLASGLLAVPGWVVSGDPLFAFNSMLVIVAVLSAIAMFALVWRWTDVPAAGVVAAVVYALHAYRTAQASHAFIYDTVWTVLALFFVDRLFVHGRIRDGVLFGVCCVLQMAEGFYPFLGAAFLAIPVAAWLIIREKRLPAWPALAAALVVLVGGGLWVFVPYLDSVAGQTAAVRVYAVWWQLTPWYVTGPLGAILIAVALVSPRRFCLGDARVDPRWALLIGTIGVGLLASGGNAYEAVSPGVQRNVGPMAFPDPYAFLARFLPGLAEVRVPGLIWVAGQVALCILVGLGAATIFRAVPGRASTAVAATLCIVMTIATVKPTWLGFEAREPLRAVELRPDEDRIAFFEHLAEQGNSGPILEVPYHQAAMITLSHQVFLSAYHHRRTSGCYMSKIPEENLAIAELAGQLFPRARIGTLRRLRDAGFTTIVLHGEAPVAKKMRKALSRAASRKGAPIRWLHRTDERAAFELRAEP